MDLLYSTAFHKNDYHSVTSRGITLFKGIYLGPEGFGMIILLAIIIGLRIDKKYSLPLASFLG
ncbi:hypothetical protein ACLMAB_00150 [Brevibacillus laterosporus]